MPFERQESQDRPIAAGRRLAAQAFAILALVVMAATVSGVVALLAGVAAVSLAAALVASSVAVLAEASVESPTGAVPPTHGSLRRSA
ncbi:MAG TPA: hypothetical protein VFP54_01790 [Acidimicrobiales bacterium]|nr:hypothetical protein [Acidimicrobiales bacterium]